MRIGNHLRGGQRRARLDPDQRGGRGAPDERVAQLRRRLDGRPRPVRGRVRYAHQPASRGSPAAASDPRFTVSGRVGQQRRRGHRPSPRPTRTTCGPRPTTSTTAAAGRRSEARRGRWRQATSLFTERRARAPDRRGGRDRDRSRSRCNRRSGATCSPPAPRSRSSPRCVVHETAGEPLLGAIEAREPARARARRIELGVAISHCHRGRSSRRRRPTTRTRSATSTSTTTGVSDESRAARQEHDRRAGLPNTTSRRRRSPATSESTTASATPRTRPRPARRHGPRRLLPLRPGEPTAPATASTTPARWCSWRARSACRRGSRAASRRASGRTTGQTPSCPRVERARLGGDLLPRVWLADLRSDQVDRARFSRATGDGHGPPPPPHRASTRCSTCELHARARRGLEHLRPSHRSILIEGAVDAAQSRLRRPATRIGADRQRPPHRRPRPRRGLARRLAAHAAAAAPVAPPAGGRSGMAAASPRPPDRAGVGPRPSETIYEYSGWLEEQLLQRRADPDGRRRQGLAGVLGAAHDRTPPSHRLEAALRRLRLPLVWLAVRRWVGRIFAPQAHRPRAPAAAPPTRRRASAVAPEEVERVVPSLEPPRRAVRVEQTHSEALSTSKAPAPRGRRVRAARRQGCAAFRHGSPRKSATDPPTAARQAARRRAVSAASIDSPPGGRRMPAPSATPRSAPASSTASSACVRPSQSPWPISISRGSASTATSQAAPIASAVSRARPRVEVTIADRPQPRVSREPLGHQRRLVASVAAERRVPVALEAAFAVPVRHAVADEDEARLGHATRIMPGSCRLEGLAAGPTGRRRIGRVAVVGERASP